MNARREGGKVVKGYEILQALLVGSGFGAVRSANGTPVSEPSHGGHNKRKWTSSLHIALHMQNYTHCHSLCAPPPSSTLFPDSHPHGVLGHYLPTFSCAGWWFPLSIQLSLLLFFSVSLLLLAVFIAIWSPSILYSARQSDNDPLACFFFFLNPRGPSTSRGSNICSGETQLAARGSRSSLYLRVAQANQNESLSLSHTVSPTLQTHPPNNTQTSQRGRLLSHSSLHTASPNRAVTQPTHRITHSPKGSAAY